MVPALPASQGPHLSPWPTSCVSPGLSRGKDPPPPAALFTLPDAEQDALPQGHMAWSAWHSPGLPGAFLPRCFLGDQLYRVIPPQGQELSLPIVQLHETSADPSLQPAKVPLSCRTPIWSVSHSPQDTYSDQKRTGAFKSHLSVNRILTQQRVLSPLCCGEIQDMYLRTEQN